MRNLARLFAVLALVVAAVDGCMSTTYPAPAAPATSPVVKK